MPAFASGSPLTTRTLHAPGSGERPCHAGRLPARDGVQTLRVTAPEPGLLRATLASRGDWDLAVFDAVSQRLVAAGAAPGDRELVEGFVGAGERLLVQACRRDGAAPTARLHAATISLGRQSAPASVEQLVSVATPDRAARDRLAGLGLDLAENATHDSVDVVLHGAQDGARLAGADLSWTVKVADLRALTARDVLSDRRNKLRAAPSGLPSGRDSYRHLADYEAELKALAAGHPGLVKLITLPHRSLLGREILGVEIARDVNVDNGQPVFLQLGTHHAREWPSAEHPMEWAYDVVNGYGNDPEITRLVDATRTIVVPVVNPDGFNLSREWPIDLGAVLAGIDLPPQVNGLLPIQDPAYIAALLADQGVSGLPGTGFSYKRRNCRVQDGRDPAPGECENLFNRRLGVDPNRNYGGFWGGPGAGFEAEDDTYRGAAPFSEPEVQNVRELVSSNQVTTLITNHTFGNLILRPPGVSAAGDPPDEALYRELGAAMAARNGYANQHGFELYDTTGTTEDWSYYATGGLGFTFEIGPNEFHPPYAQVAAQYASNRQAYLIALQSTADSARHAVVEGRAAVGTVLRVHKEFESRTSPVLLSSSGLSGPPRSFRDVLDSTITVGDSGRFAWHLNPSSRPGAPAPEAWELTCERPVGAVIARGSLVIARGERKTLDLCALRFSLAIDHRSLPRALDRGLRARARCSIACAASVTLSVNNATARRYGLAKAVSAKRVVVARGSARRTFKGRRLFNVRFSAVARRGLRGARALALRVTAVGRAGSTDRRSVTRSLTLQG
ncbi:MAG TPA: M14 family zinc carboxypeptidase [Solirubrobacteraceae bacterium]